MPSIRKLKHKPNKWVHGACNLKKKITVKKRILGGFFPPLFLAVGENFPSVPKFLCHRWAVNFWAESWKPEDPYYTLALSLMRSLWPLRIHSPLTDSLVLAAKTFTSLMTYSHYIHRVCRSLIDSSTRCPIMLFAQYRHVSRHTGLFSAYIGSVSGKLGELVTLIMKRWDHRHCSHLDELVTLLGCLSALFSFPSSPTYIYPQILYSFLVSFFFFTTSLQLDFFF